MIPAENIAERIAEQSKRKEDFITDFLPIKELEKKLKNQ